MTVRAQALFANEAFYYAFRTRDIAAMEEIWSKTTPVACIHPGWAALTTREAVMESWRSLLKDPQSPEVYCRGAEAFPHVGEVYVFCYETVGSSLLVATNIFVEESGSWKLVHHHAGLCNPPSGGLPDEAEPGAMQ